MTVSLHSVYYVILSVAHLELRSHELDVAKTNCAGHIELLTGAWRKQELQTGSKTKVALNSEWKRPLGPKY